jgi:cytoskeletal protein RodZ
MSSSKRRRMPSKTRPPDEPRPDASAADHARPPGAWETRAPEPFTGSAHGTRGQPAFELDRIGALLRQARERRGENFYTIADFLRIRPGFLAALENSRYEELPADAYVTGFLRTYAAYLGLDSKAVIDQYRREMAGRRRRPQLNMPQPISEGRAPTVAILIGAAAAVILIYALWYGLSASSRDVATAAPPLPQPVALQAAGSSFGSEPVAALPAPIQPGAETQPVLPATDAAKAPEPAQAASPAQPQPAAAASANNNAGGPAARLVLRAEKGAWVLITDSKGNTVFDQILKPGDAYSVPDNKGLKLTTGNGNGIILSLDGIDLPRLADDARIVRNVPLDPARLKAGKIQPME